jgi:hypothetical protein
MTFTFDNSLASDLALVRFHAGDTNEEGHYLEDETINYWLTATSSVGESVVRCLQYIITQLSQPNFRVDWLSVSNEQAREGYEKLLKQKAIEFGVSITGAVPTSEISLPYRADSYQDSDESEHDGAP